VASSVRSRIPLGALLNASKIYCTLYKTPLLLSASCVLELPRDSTAIVRYYGSDLQRPDVMYRALNCISMPDVYRLRRRFSFSFAKPPGEKRYSQIIAPIRFFKTCVTTYPLLDKYHLFQMLLHILKPFLRAV